MIRIPYSRQHINKDDIRAVTRALENNFITQGPNIISFENHVKKFVGVNYAIAVNSATSALHISCIAVGLKKMIFYGHQQIHSLHLPIVLYTAVLGLI